MKAKKFLKIIKKHCKEDNCGVGKCPFAKQEEKYVDCLVAVECPEDWDAKAIIKAVKKLKGGKHYKGVQWRE